MLQNRSFALQNKDLSKNFVQILVCLDFFLYLCRGKLYDRNLYTGIDY